MSVRNDPHVPIDGCLNFRDAGGWADGHGHRMRTGRLYRSDDPIRVTAAGRAAVAELGLAAVIDLRQEAQFVRSPPFVDPAITFHRPLVDRVVDLENPPPLTDPEHMADVYVGMIELGRKRIADVLDIVATHIGSGPVLVHCAFGKDRTGIVVALIQAAIGLPVEVLVEDYARSHEPAVRRRRWMLADRLPGDPPLERAPEFLFTAPAGAMEVLLEREVGIHGSLAAWVRSFPIGDDTIDLLRAALLVEDAEHRER